MQRLLVVGWTLVFMVPLACGGEPGGETGAGGGPADNTTGGAISAATGGAPAGGSPSGHSGAGGGSASGLPSDAGCPATLASALEAACEPLLGCFYEGATLGTSASADTVCYCEGDESPTRFWCTPYRLQPQWMPR